ncbi:MAG: acyltransferase [Rubrivivax sp.]|nr:MAG: acyltransferase [Rubrivivax sp.]
MTVAAVGSAAAPMLPVHAPAVASRFNLGLQGMRGIAILLVLLNHAAVPGFKGGYVGVDLFFVISGYLIGGLLLRELVAHGRIDLWAFYARRFRRLLPAFAVVLVAVLAIVPLLYAPFEHAELMSSVRASALYVANLWFASRSIDYFAGHEEANPLLHLWSLAVEEQFYLFWPLLMLLAARLFRGDARRTTHGLVMVAGLLSLLACIAVSQWKLPYAFFLTPMRIWEFAAGMLFATRPATATGLTPGKVSALGVASLLGIAGVTVFFDGGLAFPGYWALVPVAAAMGLLVVVEHGEGSAVGRLLCCGPLRWVGDCSYSVYLWHWPLMIFASLVFPRHGAGLTLALIALSLLLGWLSYHWVELPFKHGLVDTWPPRRIVAVGLLLCVTVAVAAHVLGRRPLDSQQQRYVQAATWPAATLGGCMARHEAVDQPACEFGAAEAQKTVVLFGDSHAMQWFTPLEALARQHGWRLVTLTKAQCPGVELRVSLLGKDVEYWQCTRWRESMLKRIEALKPDLVLLANYTGGYGFAPQTWRQGLADMLGRLQASGLKSAYLRDTPLPGFNVPTCLARAAWRGQPEEAVCSYARDDGDAWATQLVAAEAEALRDAGVEMLDLSGSICSQPRCPTEKDGVIMFKDRNHLSADFALRLKSELDTPLQRLLKDRP